MSADVTALLADITAECERADAKHGDNLDLADGTSDLWQRTAAAWQDRVDRRSAKGTVTWLDVLLEEVYEAAAETDLGALSAELVQVEAVCVRWRRAIQRRQERAA